MYKVTRIFICRGCVNPVTDIGCTSVDIGVNAHLELVDKFCPCYILFNIFRLHRLLYVI